MDSSSIIQIAASGWPELVTECAIAKPASDERLSTTPLWRIDASGRSYALRGWRREQRTQAEQVLSFLHHVYEPESLLVPVPIGLSGRGNGCFFPAAGMAWELSPWLAGTPCDVADITDELLESACGKLALLHARAEKLPSSDRWDATSRHLVQLAELDQQLTSGTFDLCDGSKLAWWPVDLPRPADALRRAVQLFRGQLAKLDYKTPPRQLVWGDAWINNFLFDHRKAVGLVDFVTVRPDTPMADLARLLGSVTSPKDDRWRKGVAAYDSRRGLTEFERQALGAICDVSTVLSLANWLRWLAIEQRSFTHQGAAVSRAAHFARRLASLLEMPATR